MESEDDLVRRAETDLHIVYKAQMMPSVEVDFHSIPEDVGGYARVVTRALQSAASMFPGLKATIYVCERPSVNFHEQTWSVFFAVAGQKKLEILQCLESAFRKVVGKKVKTSDYIHTSHAERDYHIEDGAVWRPEEPGTWYQEEAPSDG